MSEGKDFNKLLEKVYAKLDGIGSVDESALIEINKSINKLSDFIGELQSEDNFKSLNERLDEIENYNIDLKNSINKIMEETLSSNDNEFGDNDSVVKLQTFLTELAYQIAGIKKEFERQDDNTKNYAMEKIDEIADFLEKAQNRLNQTVQTSIQDLGDMFSQSTKGFEDKLNELSKQFEDYSTEVIREIADNLAELKENSDEISQDLITIKNTQDLALTRAEFEDYQEENHTELINKIDFIQDKIKLFNFDDIEGLKEGLSVSHKNVSKEIQNLLKIVADKEDFKNLKNTMDELHLANIIKKIDTIYNNISVLDDLPKQFETVNNKLNASMEPAMDYEDVENKIDIMYENISILNNWTGKLDYINEAIDKLNEQVYDLSQETEREQEQADKVDIIYENLSLLNSWVGKIDSISNKVDDMDESVSNINTWGYKIEEIKQKLESLSNEFAIITTATKDDTEEYIYTLLDIESDFAKLYCAFDENTKVTNEDLETLKKQFGSINDDISSISKRTNKLIISSDDTNKIFRQNLDELNALIGQLNTKVLSFNPTKQFTLIDNKVNTIKKLMAGNMSASQNLNEAFMYLAEWIDTTGVVINSIKENVENNNIKNQISVLSEKVELISESKTDLIKTVFVELKNKFISQEETIAKLETKIEKLETRLQNKLDEIIDIKQEDASSEIKTILDFIASQVISANENSINNKALGQKIEIIELQLSKFDKNLAKIVSYLDED